MEKRSQGMPLTDRSVPYYYQIANMLRRRIEQGELAPGDKLTKEMELARLFGVSRVPIRQALSLLVEEGLLHRERGRGTFITENLKKPKTLKLTGIIEEYVSHGMEGKLHLFDVEETPASPPLAEFFGLAPGGAVTRIRRLRTVEDIPFCYVMNYLPVEMARKIKRADFEKRSMLNIFEKRLRIPLGEIRQTIEARTADSEIAAHLAVGITAPVLYVETFVHGEGGEPLEFSQIYYRGDRYKYSVEQVSGRDLRAPGSGSAPAAGSGPAAE